MADASPHEINAAPADTAPAPTIDTPAKAKRSAMFRVLGLVVLAAAIGYGVWYYVSQQGREHTENAYVGADSAVVTPLVAGAVIDVRVSGMQSVRKGEILLVIDDADAKIDVATAAAALRQAEQRFAQSAAVAQAARTRVSARGTEIAQARARLAEAQALADKAQAEYRRRAALVGTGAVSDEEVSATRAAWQAATAGRDLAQAAIATAQSTQASAGGDASASEALVRGTTSVTAPDIAAARARLEAAQLALSRTTVRAPVSGIVANKQVQTGQRIAAGAPVMTIVPVETAYVDANFKEDQFKHIRVGQPVELTSDFYGSDVVFRGRVTGLAGGTGAAFSLIPAQNATGNWVKVVQRLPVRIAIDPADLRAHPLRVGLSMSAVVDTRGK